MRISQSDTHTYEMNIFYIWLKVSISWRSNKEVQFEGI